MPKPESPITAPERTPLRDRKKLLIYCGMVIAIAAVFTAIAIALMVQSPQNVGTQSDISVSGTLECLPHKGDGPHTLECAYGLRTDDHRYYSLVDAPEPVTKFSIGTRVNVEGTLKANPNSSYDIVGEIDVEKITR